MPEASSKPAPLLFQLGPGIECAGRPRRTTCSPSPLISMTRGNISVQREGKWTGAPFCLLLPGPGPANTWVQGCFSWGPLGSEALMGISFPPDLTIPWKVTEGLDWLWEQVDPLPGISPVVFSLLCEIWVSDCPLPVDPDVPGLNGLSHATLLWLSLLIPLAGTKL